MKHKFYKTGDYIHLGLALLMTGISVWGAIVAPMLVMRVISIVTALAATGSFLILTFFFRLREWKSMNAYIPLNLEMGYKAEEHSSRVLTTKILNKWTDDLINFWAEEKKIYSSSQVKAALTNSKVYFKDVHLFEYDGQKVCGLAWTDIKTVSIASCGTDNVTPDLARMYSLFRHEMSHIIVCYCGGVCEQTASHKLFVDVKLGA